MDNATHGQQDGEAYPLDMGRLRQAAARDAAPHPAPIIRAEFGYDSRSPD